MLYKYCNPGNYFTIFRVGDVLEHLTPCCGLDVQKPTQALKSVKNPDNTFDLIP